MAVDWPQLALQTLRDPKAAGARIMSWQIERNTLWMIAALVIACSTFVSYASHLITPVPEPYGSLVEQPLRLFAIMTGVFLVSVYMLFWVGRSLGGTGEMDDLLALLVWLQILRAFAQVIILVTVLVAPFLAAFLVLFILIATLWIFLNFTSVGLQLNSLTRATMVCLVTLFAIVFVIALIGPMVGLNPLGVPANV
ncbi:MAG: YIP1 family protein [Paracoccaceae bacterium]|nr:YIP1 family protein [Paracoccaceae bacterium]